MERSDQSMKIIPYDAKYKQDFVNLNKRWIQKFFKLEPHDLEQLNNIEAELKQGAMIFFALDDDGNVLSTCMAAPLAEIDTWEIAKFATNEQFQGQGAGKAVFKAAMAYAEKEKHAKKLVIYSNQSLKPALHIYQAFGFREVPVTIDAYARCDYQAELFVDQA